MDPVKFMERNLGNISCIPQNHNLMLFNQTQNHVGEDTMMLQDEMFQDFKFLNDLKDGGNGLMDDDSLFGYGITKGTPRN